LAIQFDGEFKVARSRADTFEFLADTQKFAPCLPTFQSLGMEDDGTATVKIKIGIGKVRGIATINLALEESESPTRAQYSGKGKVMGSAFNLISGFNLEEIDGGTLVKWSGELKMFGKLVALAGGLIKPIARKDIKRLIDALQIALDPKQAEQASG
jgi:carbon monoxide dehydrogenase subunit G